MFVAWISAACLRWVKRARDREFMSRSEWESWDDFEDEACEDCQDGMHGPEWASDSDDPWSPSRRSMGRSANDSRVINASDRLSVPF